MVRVAQIAHAHLCVICLQRSVGLGTDPAGDISSGSGVADRPSTCPALQPCADSAWRAVVAHRTPGAAMALAFPWTSAAVLLHPLPKAALPSFLHVLRDVPHSLAEPFIRHELSRHGISAEPHDVRNVLFKLRAAGLAHDVVGSIGPSLKALQKDVLDKPLMYIREDRESCVTCSEALCDGQRYESFDQQMSAGMRRNAPAEGPTRFRAFTFHAGFQFAVFQPKLCRGSDGTILLVGPTEVTGITLPSVSG